MMRNCSGHRIAWPCRAVSLALAIACCTASRADVDAVEGGLTGYIDKTGAMVIPAVYGDGGAFSEGLAPVQFRDDEKWGYIDKSGETIIAPRYRFAAAFKEGVALVHDAGGKWGFIDRTGAYVVEPRFSFASDFSEGLAAASVEGTYPRARTYLFGYIDKTGEFVIEPQFHSLDSFHNGIAVVSILRSDPPKHGYIRSDGTFLLGPEPWVFLTDFAEGYGVVERGLDTGHKRWVCIDAEGTPVFELDQEGTGGGGVKTTDRFSEGLIGFCKGEPTTYGFVDRAGKVIIEPKFYDTGRFSEGLAFATAEKGLNPAYGYIDQTGKFVIPPKFGVADDFVDGLAIVGVDIRRKQDFIETHLEAGQYGYIDKTGAFVIPPRFVKAAPFSEGLAAVSVKEGAGIGSK